MASALQVIGILLLAAGAAMVVPWAGLMVAGIGTLAFGLAMERSR
jgi:hypothetical protein